MNAETSSDNFALLRDAGHLACVDQPQAYAACLGAFLHDIGHC